MLMVGKLMVNFSVLLRSGSSTVGTIFDMKLESYEKNAEQFSKFLVLKKNHNFSQSRASSDIGLLLK